MQIVTTPCNSILYRGKNLLNEKSPEMALKSVLTRPALKTYQHSGRGRVNDNHWGIRKFKLTLNIAHIQS